MSHPTDLKFLIVDDFDHAAHRARLLKEMGCNNAVRGRRRRGGAGRCGAQHRLRRQRHQHANMNGFRPAGRDQEGRVAEAPAGADGHRRGAQGRHRARAERRGGLHVALHEGTLEEKVQKILQKLAAATVTEGKNMKMDDISTGRRWAGMSPRCSTSSARSRASCTHAEQLGVMPCRRSPPTASPGRAQPPELHRQQDQRRRQQGAGTGRAGRRPTTPIAHATRRIGEASSDPVKAVARARC